MEQGKNYTAAKLSPNLVDEIQSFEEKLRGQTNKEVVVIAYEKEQNELG